MINCPANYISVESGWGGVIHKTTYMMNYAHFHNYLQCKQTHQNKWFT